MSQIANLADQLVTAMETKGLAVSSSLFPGITQEQFASTIRRSKEDIPASLFDLYGWRNGSNEDAVDQLVFRDNTFISVERAREELDALLQVWSFEGEARFRIEDLIPIASFDGSIYAVVAGDHAFWHLPDPVVNIFEGDDLFFDSIESMLQTCIAWVNEPAWTRDGLQDERKELEIWRRLNSFWVGP